jgi:ketosteroid isomerase-like protein
LTKLAIACGGCVLCAAVLGAQQGGDRNERGQVLALETAWNHAIEVKDTRALDLLLADSMVAVSSDGSLATKKAYLDGIRAQTFQPSQAVNEENKVELYGDTAVAVGVFRIREVEKGKPSTHRERTVDTWIKMSGTWRCVAATAVTIPKK